MLNKRFRQCEARAGAWANVFPQYVSTCAVSTTGAVSCWGEGHGTPPASGVFVTQGDKTNIVLAADGTATPWGWYALAAPTFANASAGGLRVIARNCSTGSTYVSSIYLNGARLAAPFARHADLLAPPALLEFVMTDTPVPWDYVPPV